MKRIVLTALIALGIVLPSVAGAVTARNSIVSGYDPCQILPKLSVVIPVQTPTSALVAPSSTSIYICSVETVQTAGGTTQASPGLQLWYGAANAAGTPCATGAPVEIMPVGQQGMTQLGNSDDGTFFVVPQNKQLCGLAQGANTVFLGGVLNYVLVHVGP